MGEQFKYDVFSRACVRSGSGSSRLQSPMALSASIDDALRGIACFSLLALRLFARALADDPLLTHAHSHSSKDKAVVRSVAERLWKDSLRVWFDEWEIKVGDSIPARIYTVFKNPFGDCRR